MYTICLVGCEQGAGKTTVAENIAQCLAIFEHKTLLVDLDPRHPLRSLPRPGLELFSELAENTTSEHLKTLTPRIDPFALELEPPAPDSLKKALSKRSFDFAVLDCPPFWGQPMLQSLFAADLILIVSDALKDDRPSLGFSLRLCAELKKARSLEQSPIVLLNKVKALEKNAALLVQRKKDSFAALTEFCVLPFSEQALESNNLINKDIFDPLSQESLRLAKRIVALAQNRAIRLEGGNLALSRSGTADRPID